MCFIALLALAATGCAGRRDVARVEPPVGARPAVATATPVQATAIPAVAATVPTQVAPGPVAPVPAAGLQPTVAALPQQQPVFVNQPPVANPTPGAQVMSQSSFTPAPGSQSVVSTPPNQTMILTNGQVNSNLVTPAPGQTTVNYGFLSETMDFSQFKLHPTGSPYYRGGPSQAAAPSALPDAVSAEAKTLVDAKAAAPAKPVVAQPIIQAKAPAAKPTNDVKPATAAALPQVNKPNAPAVLKEGSATKQLTIPEVPKDIKLPDLDIKKAAAAPIVPPPPPALD